jgi:hypothetical protein
MKNGLRRKLNSWSRDLENGRGFHTQKTGSERAKHQADAKEDENRDEEIE